MKQITTFIDTATQVGEGQVFHCKGRDFWIKGLAGILP